MVLVNSLGTDLSLWDPIIDALSVDRDILRYDARGHGQTPDPGDPYLLDDLVADLVSLLDEERIERAHFAGISIGGMTILRLAQLHPERVRSIAPACCAAHLPHDEWVARAQLVRDGGVAAISDVVMTRWFTESARKSDPDPTEPYRAMLLRTDSRSYSAACEALANLDIRQGLAAISVPTVVVSADADVATPPWMQREIADAIPGSRLVSLDHAGHIAIAEGGAQLSAILVEHARQADRDAVGAGAVGAS
jgi:3-oxoadipate enol-lactonase